MTVFEAARLAEGLNEVLETAKVLHGDDWGRTAANCRSILESGPDGRKGVLAEAIRRAGLARSAGEQITWLAAALETVND